MIYEKLQKARVTLQNKKLKKSGKNAYSGFTYYELADFLPSVNQIFEDLKLFSNFSIDENKAFLTVTDWEDNTNEVFTSPIETLELKGCSRIQALGGVHTYMKRYLYLNALEIIESDMLDQQAGKIEEEQPIDPDLDILEGLYAQSDSGNAASYYQSNKANVVNFERFKAEYAKLYTKLRAKEKKQNG